MTRVKICGITNLNDARLAVEAGADALGFNFYQKSPRYISPIAAGEIIAHLGAGVRSVGVFVNETVQTVVSIVNNAQLDAIQLHGDEPREFIRDLRDLFAGDVIKAIRVSEGFSPKDAVDYHVEDILLDGFSTSARGGTGETFDWDIAKSVSELVGRLYLAGGLTQENVGTAISYVRPFAVDACTSLEAAHGIKDPIKLRKFITEAKRHD